jgi:hypothetical protein
MKEPSNYNYEAMDEYLEEQNKRFRRRANRIKIDGFTCKNIRHYVPGFPYYEEPYDTCIAIGGMCFCAYEKTKCYKYRKEGGE